MGCWNVRSDPRENAGAMQIPLRDLVPHWLNDGARNGVGIRFQCPSEHDHELKIWFRNPVDGRFPMGVDSKLYQRDGEGLDDLSLYPPMICGDCLIVVYEGQVNVIYL